MRFLIAAATLLLLTNCARSPLKDRMEALRLTKPVELRDQIDLDSLKLAIEQNIKHLESYPSSTFQAGPYVVDKEHLIKAQSDLLRFINQNKTEGLSEYIRQHFEYMEVYGGDDWGEVFVTSYFDPVIKGSRRRTKKFTQPIYRVPKDMVIIRLDQFLNRFPSLNIAANEEQKSNGSILRGRFVRPKEKDQLPLIVPYYDRKEIDESRPLAKQNLEIAWVDPLDSFFLQIQGSGKIEFPDGKLIRVGYAAQNGHRYEAIGKFLKDKIPLEEMTMHNIEAHLRSLSSEEMQRILNLNPSYVFFRELESKSITSFGSEVVPQRTIATDHRYFPKGMLAYLDIDVPVFDDPSSLTPTRFERRPRLVVDQDTGGAIRGGGRVDLYWGEGDEAKRHAGVMKQKGRLHYLLPKSVIASSYSKNE